MKLRLISGALAALTASVAFAQAAGTTDHPKPVATSQQTADEASQKATQQGEGKSTATVVRTGPSAADHMHRATAKAKQKAGDAKDKVTSTTDTKSDK
jgi:hypothetical protein